jgi:hypothetical protein
MDKELVEREKSGACDREVQIAVANSDGTLIGIGKNWRCVGGCLRRYPNKALQEFDPCELFADLP